MGRCTIIIPTHNRAVLLERAVVSALMSCPRDGEVWSLMTSLTFRRRRFSLIWKTSA